MKISMAIMKSVKKNQKAKRNGSEISKTWHEERKYQRKALLIENQAMK
jgi:hypothetical protein